MDSKEEVFSKWSCTFVAVETKWLEPFKIIVFLSRCRTMVLFIPMSCSQPQVQTVLDIKIAKWCHCHLLPYAIGHMTSKTTEKSADSKAADCLGFNSGRMDWVTRNRLQKYWHTDLWSYSKRHKIGILSSGNKISWWNLVTNTSSFLTDRFHHETTDHNEKVIRVCLTFKNSCIKRHNVINLNLTAKRNLADCMHTFPMDVISTSAVSKKTE